MSGSDQSLCLTSPRTVRLLLESLSVRPSKRLGQNFLIDGNTRDIIVSAAGVTERDTVLEIGPGLGALTERLLACAARVIAVEKDPRLADHLEAHFGREGGFRLVRGDILDIDLPGLLADGVTRCVSNLPYSVGSRVLVELAQLEQRPPRITVTVQHEVAARMGARPGSRDFGVLSVLLQQGYTVSVVRAVSPTCFWPRPDIRSAIVNLVRRDDLALQAEARRCFDELVRHAFEHRRKQLSGILRDAPDRIRAPGHQVREWLSAAGRDPQSRPEDLSADNWCELAKTLTSTA